MGKSKKIVPKKAEAKPYFFYLEQEETYKILKAQGFAFRENTRMGIEMAKIDKDEYVQKVVITIGGISKRYKATKPTKIEKQILRSTSATTYNNII